jgi:hypothetical protein
MVGVSAPGEDWPSLVVLQTFGPAAAGFHPAALVVPEKGRVFIGAGPRVVSYARVEGGWNRDWQYDVFAGFWGWRQHGDVIVMLSEIEMAAWSSDGHQLWTTLVEPPWSYSVEHQTVRLDVMGAVTEFPLRTGPMSR